MADAVVSAKVGPASRFFSRERVDEIVLLLREAEKFILEAAPGQETAPPERKQVIEQAIAEGYKRAYDRLELCPDHRDKATGRCIVCVAEERTRRELKAERAAQETAPLPDPPQQFTGHDRSKRFAGSANCKEAVTTMQKRCESIGPEPERFQCGLPSGHDGDHSALIPTAAPWWPGNVSCKARKTADPHAEKVIAALEESGRLLAAPGQETAPLPDWLPIESAPKDGTPMLLYGEGVVTYGGWMSAEDQGAEPGEEHLIAEGWWSIDLRENKPTHWMPLPAPPAALGHAGSDKERTG